MGKTRTLVNGCMAAYLVSIIFTAWRWREYTRIDKLQEKLLLCFRWNLEVAEWGECVANKLKLLFVFTVYEQHVLDTVKSSFPESERFKNKYIDCSVLTLRRQYLRNWITFENVAIRPSASHIEFLPRLKVVSDFTGDTAFCWRISKMCCINISLLCAVHCSPFVHSPLKIYIYLDTVINYHAHHTFASIKFTYSPALREW